MVKLVAVRLVVFLLVVMIFADLHAQADWRSE